MEVLFWISAGLMFYTFAGYPVLIALLALPKQPHSAYPLCGAAPSVSICVAVHNERSRLPAKLASLRALVYPKDRVQIVFSSDGSKDGTNEFLAGETDVVLVPGERAGKAVALNRAVATANGEVVIFTDARQTLTPDSVSLLVDHLQDTTVGAASGLLSLRPGPLEGSNGAGLYWRYESWIRRCESRVFSTVGATGALYAIRRTDFVPLRPGTILDDVEVPIQVLRTGRRIILEERAIAYDEAPETADAEMARKVRTLTGNFQTFANQPWLFLPWRNPAWFQFLSHKVLRLAVPYFMAVSLVTSALLSAPLYRTALIVQTGCYVPAVLALLVPRLQRNALLRVSAAFLSLNFASVLALITYATGRTGKVWVPSNGP